MEIHAKCMCMGRAQVCNSNDFERAIVACFALSANLCVHVWDEIDDALPNGVMIFHLLWVLLFLKVYGTEDTMEAMVKTM